MLFVYRQLAVVNYKFYVQTAVVCSRKIVDDQPEILV